MNNIYKVLLVKVLLRLSVRALILIIFSLLSLDVYSQAVLKSKLALSVGDSIPDSIWNLKLQVVNDLEDSTVILNDYRGKLIILDFWATWCGSCISEMPRIKVLEKEYANDMIVIPITNESRDKVRSFLQHNHVAKSLNLSSVINGNVLEATFPHASVPYYVWITPSGRVAAFTTSDRVTAKNIERSLTGKEEEIPLIKSINPERPLLLSNMFNLDDLTHYSILTRGNIDGLPSGNRYRRENGIVRGRAITNSTILQVYTSIASQLFEINGESFNYKRFIVSVSDSSKLSYDNIDYGTDRISSRINYELVVPTHRADSLYDYMLRDLNRYTDYFGRIEKQWLKCLVLTKIGVLKEIKSNIGKKENTLFSRQPAILRGYSLDVLVMRLNELRNIDFLILDETNYQGNISLEFSGKIDFATLKKELNAQGLDLVEVERMIDMFILEDKH